MNAHMDELGHIRARLVTTEGERRVPGVDVGRPRIVRIGTAFLRGLVTRGLRGVRLVISG